MKEDLEGEIWKDVLGYEGLYQVSNMGRVYSLPREWVIGTGGKRKHLGIIMTFTPSGNGYQQVWLSINCKRKKILVHQLVAQAFLGHVPCGLELVVDHINDNPSDNRLYNLQIVTTRFNSHKTQGKYSSQYKGVHLDKQNNKWRAQIEISGKKKHLGIFDCELKAHYVYQNALKELV